MYADPQTGERRNGIVKVRYSHAALIDAIVANPTVTQRQLAAYFGYTEAWISQIMSSDAFQAALAARKEEIIDPLLRMTVEERLKGLTLKSIEVLQEHLATIRDPEIARDVLSISTKALGYGARGPQVQVNNYVAVMPEKAKSSELWEQAIIETGVPRDA